ncbi:Rrf2 family transcriptional regulator [Paenibacillus elgii]|uniref:Transcriptional regulator n=1 Tax=Paenibacillus elgii TaxID=189691 RepID=A0A2T6FX18_9BACL|nr:Rrf2 family transcriptional regulator [Paenibacillus elgii]MCM3269658.1 Rrf2 family transcriptional regulator [Paenibacillus elgii]PUA36450.1 transcriptional regulator [Paenibacillus elgii]
MRISSRFSIAVHMLTLINVRTDHQLTSEQIADSVNTNAVIIRQISSLLKKAGLIEVKRGTGGAYLLKEPSRISLYDIFNAVDVLHDDGLFHTHENQNPMCWVGSNINEILGIFLLKAQHAMEEILRDVSLGEITELIKQKRHASS